MKRNCVLRRENDVRVLSDLQKELEGLKLI